MNGAVTAEYDLAQDVERRQGDERDLRTVGDLTWICCGSSLPCGQRRKRRLVDVVDNEFLAHAEQMLRHGKPHFANADEADSHDGLRSEHLIAI